MPEISRFLGIVIRMYFFGHAPPRAELLENWRRLQADEPPARIAPLE